ncbi:MAG: class I SAM-dependent methyltransferase [Candidatus Methanoperedens sp.]
MQLVTVHTELCSVFGNFNDKAWLDVIVRSIKEPIIRGLALPGFPEPDFQARTGGSAGILTLQEAFNFWKIVKIYADSYGIILNKGSKILDFGCGWGRMTRFFLRDLPGEDVWGVDVGLDMISQCHKHFRTGHFELVKPTPPTTLPKASFDIIYAYSVFSHLNEEVSLAWIQELAQLLKPGGLLLVTTQGRRFIDYCEEIRQKGHPANTWEETLSQIFIDRDEALEVYDRGEFLHAPTGGGEYLPGSFYGETLIPRAYVEQVWGRILELLDFNDDPLFLPQALIVMRKR